METLLHITARNGDADLVEWLDAHSEPHTFNDRWITADPDVYPSGADPEERNSTVVSRFLKHFFESYDPKEEDHNAIYHLLPPRSLLSIALGSAEPEVMWMILDRGLTTGQDIGNAWTEVTSLEGEHALLTKMGNDRTKYSEIQNLLMSYGGFTPPPTPKVATQEGSPLAGKSKTRGGSTRSRGFHPSGRATHRSKTKPQRTFQGQPSSEEAPVPMENGTTDTPGVPKNGGRGKARGRWSRSRSRLRSRPWSWAH
ncbi:hypothetical protein JVU11DRAFT_946 [Chiua virens]|nr:hypothetical protein JVU11DRAFT_946 [Chiua virens]